MNDSFIIAGAVLLACAGCGNSPVNSDVDSGPNYYHGAPGADAGPLAVCILGGWLTDADPCGEYGCTADSGQPECAKSDCELQGYDVYQLDGGVWGGEFVYSSQSGSYSSIGAPSFESYAVADGGVVSQIGSSSPQFDSVSCSATTLVGDGYAVDQRASGALEGSLESLIADGGIWRGVAFPN